MRKILLLLIALTTPAQADDYEVGKDLGFVYSAVKACPELIPSKMSASLMAKLYHEGPNESFISGYLEGEQIWVNQPNKKLISRCMYAFTLYGVGKQGVYRGGMLVTKLTPSEE